MGFITLPLPSPATLSITAIVLGFLSVGAPATAQTPGSDLPTPAPSDNSVAPPIDLLPGDAADLFESGLRALENRDFVLAIGRFDGALSAGGENTADIHFYRGIAYEAVDDLDLALADFDTALMFDLDRRPEAFARRGDIYEQLGNDQAALDDYAKAIAEDFEFSGDIHAARARIFIDTNRLNLARPELDDAIRLGSSAEGQTRRARGLIRLADNQFEAAILDLNVALQFGPPNPAGLHRARAEAYSALGEFIAASKDLTIALSFKTEDLGDLYALRGDAFRSLDNIAAAIGDYTVALENETNAPVFVHIARGQMFERQGDFQAAIDDYTAALDLNLQAPPDILLRRARAAEKFGQLDDALADYARAGELGDDDAELQRGLGYSYHGLQRMDLAVGAFGNAFRLAPDIIFGLDWRGYTHYYLGNFEMALADFNAVLDFDSAPKDMQAFALLWVHIVQARLDRADTDLLTTRAADLSLTAWPVQIIELFNDQLSPADIIAMAEDSAPETMMSRLTVAHFYIGQYHLLRGETNAAIAAFELVVEQQADGYSEFTDAMIELERLGVVN